MNIKYIDAQSGTQLRFIPPRWQADLGLHGGLILLMLCFLNDTSEAIEKTCSVHQEDQPCRSAN